MEKESESLSPPLSSTVHSTVVVPIGNVSPDCTEVSKETDRDRSTTFRSLQKLVGLGLCVKETKTIKEGGYFHVYSVVDMETFRAETERRVKDLQKSLDRLLKKFEGEMQKAISSTYEK